MVFVSRKVPTRNAQVNLYALSLVDRARFSCVAPMVLTITLTRVLSHLSQAPELSVTDHDDRLHMIEEEPKLKHIDMIGADIHELVKLWMVMDLRNLATPKIVVECLS